MQTILVVTPNIDTAITHIEHICKEEGLSQSDCTFLQFENPIGIEEARNIKKSLFFKPLKGNKKAIIIGSIHTATIEAQNAMLKIFEEPPSSTTIFATATTTNGILPTILSRCQIIFPNITNYDTSEQDPELVEAFSSLYYWTLTKKLAYAQSLSQDKEKAAAWALEMLRAARHNLLTNFSTDIIPFIEQLQIVYQQITTTNINLRFLLENTLLSFPKSV